MFGFAMQYKNLIPTSFFDKSGGFPLTLEINPDTTEPMKRMIIKYETETENFDPERYANDNYDQETVAEIDKIATQSSGVS